MSYDISQNPFALSSKFSVYKIHLGITGSIACYKAIELLRAFVKMQIAVSATLTAGARHFVSPLLFRSLGASPVYNEMFEDENDVFGHLEPGQNMHAMLIAPASANSIARLANGLADDMLAAQAVAFSGKIILAPAMNPRMWANAATSANMEILRQRGYLIVEPGTGGTACGDEGKGRLAELPEIFLHTLYALAPKDMAGLKVLVTLGPTREPWDGVRFLSNPSSGRMGAALATAAWLRGADVTAICGPGISICLPAGVKRIDVNTAVEMFTAADKAWPQMDMGLFSAAVSDFAPVRPPQGDNIKIKKAGADENVAIKLDKNPDILASLSQKRGPGQKILGFAAEIAPDMDALLPLAQLKLNGKKADIIAANRVNHDSGSFGADEGRMAVVDKNGLEEIWGTQSKADIAWDLCSWLLRL